jgi:hypothetical protein
MEQTIEVGVMTTCFATPSAGVAIRVADPMCHSLCEIGVLDMAAR